jgi:hypothetical protein
MMPCLRRNINNNAVAQSAAVYSMIRSAWISCKDGIVRPRASAVFPGTWHHGLEELQLSADRFFAGERQSGHIAARMRQARHETGADRVVAERKDDRGRGCLCAQHEGHLIARRHQKIRRQPRQFGGKRRQAIGISVGPAAFDDEIVRAPAKRCQLLAKRGRKPGGRRLRRLVEKADDPLSLLREPWERPEDSGAGRE